MREFDMRRHKLTWKQKIIWTFIILAALLAGTVEPLSFSEWSRAEYHRIIVEKCILMEKIRYFKEVVLWKTE
jgi:hypothetical protein